MLLKKKKKTIAVRAKTIPEVTKVPGLWVLPIKHTHTHTFLLKKRLTQHVKAYENIKI